MMANAAVVPHYLMTIAGGAGILGMFMLVTGFFQAVGELPKPVWLYPFHYISFESYAFAGLMKNEFKGTDGWQCPCALQPGGCPVADCTLTGEQVLTAWTVPNAVTKWADVGILFGMAGGYRLLFTLALKMKEKMSRS